MPTAVGQFSNRSQYRLVMDCWEASYNVANNDSWVQWSLRIDESPNNGSWSNAALTWSTSVHGQGWSGSTTYDFRNYDSLGLGSGGRAVGHQADGSQEIGFSAGAGGGTTIGGASCGGAFWLTTIPRKSTPSFVTPAYDQLIVGSNSYMVMNRASGSFTHDLDYWFGGIGQTRAISGAGHDGNWTVPWAFANQLPNSNTGVGTMRTHTYSGGSMIGYVDQSFRVYVPDNATTKPTFTSKAVAEDNAAVTAVMGAGKYVQGLSRLKGTLTGASAKYSASVSAQTMQVAGQSVNLLGSPAVGATGLPISQSGVVPVTFSVRDSRGFTYSDSATTIDVLPYALPSLASVEVVRANSSGAPQEDGTYLRVKLSAAVTSLINSTQRNRLTVRAYTRQRGTSTWTLRSTPVSDSSTLTYNPVDGFFFAGPYDVEKSYEVRIEVTDKFATVASEFTISVAGIFQHWTKDTTQTPAKSVMGIGKYWEQGTLDVGGAIYAEGRMVVTAPVPALLDPAYVGPGPAKVMFLPGSTLSAEAYPWRRGYKPNGQRVVNMVRQGNSWVIDGHTEDPAYGGAVRIDLDPARAVSYTSVTTSSLWTEQIQARKTAAGIVSLSGMCQVLANSGTNILGNVPAGFRPDMDMIFPLEVGDVRRTITLRANGDIESRGWGASATFFSLTGISYPAAGVATWTPVGSSGSAFQNGWGNHSSVATYGVPAFWKDPYGVTWFRGMLGGGTANADNINMFSLPSGYGYPSLQTHQAVANSDGFGFVSSRDVSGVQYIAWKSGSTNNGWISLSGLNVLTADALAQPGWSVPNKFNGWVNYGAGFPGYEVWRRPDGLVTTKGLVRAGTIGAIMTILERHQRAGGERHILAAVSGASRGRLDMQGELSIGNSAPGEIFINAGANSWVSFDGLTWPMG